MIADAIAPVRKSIDVNASIERAFDVFTSGLMRWWPRTIGVSKTPLANVLMEPRLGGRWLEIADDGTETVVATIAHWEPPHRLVLLWHVNGQFKPDLSMKSEVDVRFTADGSGSTHVELLHHKFETMGVEGGAILRGGVDGGWPGLLKIYAAKVEAEAAGNLGYGTQDMNAQSHEGSDDIAAIVQSFAAQMVDPSKSFAMVVRFQVNEGSQNAVEQAFVIASTETAKEDGVIVYHLNREAKDRTRFVLYERWKSLADLDAHLRTPYIRLLRDQLNALIVGEAEFVVLTPAVP